MFIAGFHKALYRWYQANGRHELPWRNTPDAYAIYVSEIMLQQTQVKTVLERFYFPFLQKFPTLKALAKASQQEVLAAWQGLGYYSRAINLHEAAKRCPKGLPQSVETLMALPGIGRNTAGAIAAFAFRKPEAVMEANVKRVLCRVFALESPSEKTLWEKAYALLDVQNPFDYNQAMMDVGAMICTKTAPKCPQCPAQKICVGKNNPALYPAAKSKKAVPIRKRHIIVVHNGRGGFAASARSTRFLKGLYEFGETENPPPKTAKKIGEITQSYSHFTLQAQVWLMKAKKQPHQQWFARDELEKLPMSMAEKKLLAML